MATISRYGNIEIYNNLNLELLLSTNPAMRAGIEEAIGVLMWAARNSTSEAVRKYIFDDAREAHRAVRNVVYRKVLGGEINILKMKRAARSNKLKPLSHRYGNIYGPKRYRTKDTNRMQSYYGKDLGFILRFISGGTPKRMQTPSTHMDGKSIDFSRRERIREQRDYYHDKSKGEKFKGRIGNRGAIKEKNFFSKEAQNALLSRTKLFEAEIDKLFNKLLNNE